MLRASHYGNIQILIPMLVSASEIEQTLVDVVHAKKSLPRTGVPFDRTVEIGGMIEIPAAVLAIRRIDNPPRFPVDRHQRPDPVHARDRPHR